MTKPQNFRAWLALCHDLAATALAWAAMYLVRFNLDFREPYLEDMMIMLAWILPLQGTIFVAFGLYRGLWRFASLLDVDAERVRLWLFACAAAESRSHWREAELELARKLAPR